MVRGALTTRWVAASRPRHPEPAFLPPPHCAYNPPHERPDDGLSPDAVDHLPARRIGRPPPRGRLADRRQVNQPLHLRRLRRAGPPPRRRPAHAGDRTRRPRRHARLEPWTAPRGLLRHPADG